MENIIIRYTFQNQLSLEKFTVDVTLDEIEEDGIFGVREKCMSLHSDNILFESDFFEYNLVERIIKNKE